MKRDFENNRIFDELKRFHASYEKVYIYGSGIDQKKYKKYLEIQSLKIAGLVVSKERYEDEEGVYCIDDIAKNKQGVGFLMMMSDVNYSTVLKTILSLGFGIEDILIVTEEIKRFINKDVLKKSDNKIYSDVSIDKYNHFFEYINSKSKKNSYNLFLHRHLGDNIVLLGLKEEFEKKYNKPLFFILQKSQEILAIMYGIKDYAVVDFDIIVNESEIDNYSKYEIDKFRENLCEKIFSSIPQMDRPFICSPCAWIQERLGRNNFVNGWAKMLGLNTMRIKPPTRFPEISLELRDKLKQIDHMKNIVLFAPEAQTFKSAPQIFWKELKDSLQKKGYSIITNAMSEENYIEGTHNLKLSLNDLIAIGGNCHSVYSLRSGLCDALAAIGDKLYAIYKPEMLFEYFSLNECFDIKEKINEIDSNELIQELIHNKE